ncbi:NAD(+)/NADH kinase [Candidatus Woesearchaeota archaeon]|nr:NAD(+)/NADH kinase [Candidatus Woesearchaeota archaeon]
MTYKTFNVVSANTKSVDEVRRHFKFHGFKLSTKPDFVVSVGGDGTLFFAERAYPGIPKLMLRESKKCLKCENVELELYINALKKGKVKTEKHKKLEASFPVGRKKEKTYCVNDFVLRNFYPTYALRFNIKSGKNIIGEELIGDGIVVATSFGATGYFESITRHKFSRGIGVAFNNLTKPKKHILLNEKSKIEIELLRGEAVFTADNDPVMYRMQEGARIRIRQSTKEMGLLRLG